MRAILPILLCSGVTLGGCAAVEPASRPAVPPAGDTAMTEVAPETVDAPSPAGGLLARLTGGPGAARDPEEAAARAPARPPSSEPDITAGAPLAFGSVGRVCDLSPRDRGNQVARFPETRRSGGYVLYDSAPGQIASRPFYITGFSDGCARQVTAANVIFGAPSMHERLRYGLPAGTVPASRTDEAYKTLKTRVCRVPRSAPCGDRIDRLERNTVFVTMYESFSGNQNWSNLLLHDGAVFAADSKGRG